MAFEALGKEGKATSEHLILRLLGISGPGFGGNVEMQTKQNIPKIFFEVDCQGLGILTSNEITTMNW